MKIDESWGKLGKIKENWKSCENWRSCKNLKNCENWMKLAKIGVNWSAEVDENWWKLMKVDENWKSCENLINKRSRKIEWNYMKFEKLDEVAKIGQIEVNSTKLRKIAENCEKLHFFLQGKCTPLFFRKNEFKIGWNWCKLSEIEGNWRKLKRAIFAICINFR